MPIFEGRFKARDPADEERGVALEEAPAAAATVAGVAGGVEEEVGIAVGAAR